MARPPHLPDFEAPPLDEVIIGIQYAPPPAYDDRYIRDVWALFENEFPKFKEVGRLEPVFELFGGPSGIQSIRFELSQIAPRRRYWFLSEDETHLIQYQEDRLLLNWRRRPDNTEYPRFDSILSRFEEYFDRLSKLIRDKGGTQIQATKVELSYINVIPIEESKALSRWLTIVAPSSLAIENLNASFTEVVSVDRKPVGRMHHELTLVTTKEPQKALRLSLTLRGAAAPGTLSAVTSFLEMAREKIASRFIELTTSEAQEKWGRIK